VFDLSQYRYVIWALGAGAVGYRMMSAKSISLFWRIISVGSPKKEKRCCRSQFEVLRHFDVNYCVAPRQNDSTGPLSVCLNNVSTSMHLECYDFN
jgi:hypothetical protein